MSGIIGSAGSKSGVIGVTELDYEEGTWTPAPEAIGGEPSFDVATGDYVRIGNLVTVRCYMETSGTGTAGRFQGLPFTAKSQGHCGSVYSYGISWPSGTYIMAYTRGGHPMWYFAMIASDTTPVSTSPVFNHINDHFYMSMTYEISL